MADEHRYAYDKSVKGHKSMKDKCPGCGKRRFVRFFDFEAMEYLPEQFGKCDREDHCGYVETPWEWLKAKGIDKGEGIRVERQWKEPAERVKVQEVGKDTVKGTMRAYRANNLYLYLESVYGTEVADYLMVKYFVGTAKNNGTIFWQVDRYMRVRTAQKIHYKLDGHRDKSMVPPSLRLFTVDEGYEPCLFGEHLLFEESPYKTIALVESEKTAVIASVHYPEYIWLATTGMHGGYTDGKMEALRDRNVILVPDFSYVARATWGMVPMRKKIHINGQGKEVLKVDEEGEIVSEYKSYAMQLKEKGVHISFWKGYEHVNDGSDLADYLLGLNEKTLIKEPEWESLSLADVGSDSKGSETTMGIGTNASADCSRTPNIDEIIREKYGYSITPQHYEEIFNKIKGQITILQDSRVQMMLDKLKHFDLEPKLIY